MCENTLLQAIQLTLAINISSSLQGWYGDGGSRRSFIYIHTETQKHYNSSGVVFLHTLGCVLKKKDVNNILLNQFTILALAETLVVPDKLCGVISCFLLAIFLNVSDQVSICFSCLGEHCNAVLLWSSRNVVWHYESSHDFPSARGGEENDWFQIFSVGWWRRIKTVKDVCSRKQNIELKDAKALQNRGEQHSWVILLCGFITHISLHWADLNFFIIKIMWLLQVNKQPEEVMYFWK